MDIKEKIKRLRSFHGLTQEQFADRLGIPLGTVRNMERKTDPSWSQFQQIVADAEFAKFTNWLINDESAIGPGESLIGKALAKSPGSDEELPPEEIERLLDLHEYETRDRSFESFIHDLSTLIERYKSPGA